jgi:hypothetical protein
MPETAVKDDKALPPNDDGAEGGEDTIIMEGEVDDSRL